MPSAEGIGNELGLSGKLTDFARPIQVVRYSLQEEHSLLKRQFFNVLPIFVLLCK